MSNQSIQSYPFKVIFIALILVLGGCSGGTGGTGLNSNSTTVDGAVKSLTGEPIAGVTVTGETLNSTDSDVTNEQGEFSLELGLDDSEEVQFSINGIVDGEEFESVTIVNNLPQDSERVTLEFEIDSINRRIIANRVEAVRREAADSEEDREQKRQDRNRRPEDDGIEELRDPVSQPNTTTTSTSSQHRTEHQQLKILEKVWLVKTSVKN